MLTEYKVDSAALHACDIVCQAFEAADDKVLDRL